MSRFFSNRPNNGGYTENFFRTRASGVSSAQLACPFFTNVEPIRILLQSGCEQIQLLVRLCEVTSAEALREARDMRGVHVRFFSTPAFHAKFYILGPWALLGSANLTGGGLRQNRELSVEIGSREESFDEMPALFDELWNAAAVLTDDAMRRFEAWRRLHGPQISSRIDGIPEVSPPTIHVRTRMTNRVRTYLESFRRQYVELVQPAYRQVAEVYREKGRRHPDLESYPLKYELDRFFYWLPSKTTDDSLSLLPLRRGVELKQNIAGHIEEWFGVHGPAGYFDDANRWVQLTQLQAFFASPGELDHSDFDSLTESLLACAAFHDRLRFAKDGLRTLVRNFKQENKFEDVLKTFKYLAFGQGDYVQRIYDCVYTSEYKLRGWGPNCTFELFGWINHDDVPPVNGRVMKALRFLGFDVPIHS